MKKIILIFCLFLIGLLATTILVFRNYSSEVNNNLFKKEKEIEPAWASLFDFTNKRMQVINDLYTKYSCDNKKQEKTFDSIYKLKEFSRDIMKKDFHSLELKTNFILLKLYDCKTINKTQLDSLIKPYNDSLYMGIINYNNLVRDYNNEIHRFPNNLFIDNEGHVSRRFLRIDYSNNLKNEVEKQSEVEHWIKTGNLPNE